MEVCLDEHDDVWVVLHSGSRGVGNEIAKRHIDGAKKIMKQYFIELDDPDLAYFAQGTPEFDAYIHDMLWAQDYARSNREQMMDAALDALEQAIGRAAEARRNRELPPQLFRARAPPLARPLGHPQGCDPRCEGDKGIIPGSMATGTYIVEGLGQRARLLLGLARRGAAHVTRRRPQDRDRSTSSATRWPARPGTTARPRRSSTRHPPPTSRSPT